MSEGWGEPASRTKVGCSFPEVREWSLGFRYAVHVCSNFVSGGDSLLVYFERAEGRRGPVGES